MELSKDGNLIIHPTDMCFSCRYSGLSKRMVDRGKICTFISAAYHGYVSLPTEGDPTPFVVNNCPTHCPLLKEVTSGA